MTAPRTSATHPLEVGWIVPGRVGLTFAPGKHAPSTLGAPWQRDLRADLDVLARLGVGTLVSLVEEHELKSLRIVDLVERARELSIVVERFPIVDGDVPADPEGVRALVDAVVDRQARGERVVIHCRGGLGRAGTVGGCVLVALGHEPERALEILAAARGPTCPETEAQRAFIRSFAASVRARPVPVMGPHALDALASLGEREDRFAGAVLGAAIGDAMGHPTEFVKSFEDLRQKFGPRGVEGFALTWDRDGRTFAPYTDDTQMAELVLRALLLGVGAGAGLDGAMSRMAREFVAWAIRPQGGHRAPGNACLAGCRALELGAPWRSAGAPRAGGCGSVMRAYPFGLVFGDDPAQAELWATEHSRLTHGDPIALAACAAMAVGVALALRREPPAAVAGAMAQAARRSSPETADMIERAAAEAADGTAPEVTLSRLLGWAAHEAIAAGVYVFLRHADDPSAAILEAANTPGDSDSIATLAGALVGARLGARALPSAWVLGVERGDALLGLALHAARLTEDAHRETTPRRA